MNEERFGPLPGGKELVEYISLYRRADFPPLEMSDPFDLFPDQPVPAGISPKSDAHRSWPFGHRAGVYMIYSMAFKILYIGKASMKKRLGDRLYTYFGNGEKCILRAHHKWPDPPRFLVNIAVPADMPFEAPSIEEYLIGKLNPIWNVVGRRS
jgi:hypothetical protein